MLEYWTAPLLYKSPAKNDNDKKWTCDGDVERVTKFRYLRNFRFVIIMTK